jgi:hypothetical protein
LSRRSAACVAGRELPSAFAASSVEKWYRPRLWRSSMKLLADGIEVLRGKT